MNGENLGRVAGVAKLEGVALAGYKKGCELGVGTDRDNGVAKNLGVKPVGICGVSNVSCDGVTGGCVGSGSATSLGRI